MSEIKVGDFVEVDGVRALVYDVTPSNAVKSITKQGRENSVRSGTTGMKHLPDCTGWDWKPKLQLKGGAYYENADGKIVGPLEVDTGGKWVTKPVPGGLGYWFNDDGTSPTPEWSLVREVEPPKPKYRPFKDVWEMLDHAKGDAVVYGGYEYKPGMLDVRKSPDDLTIVRLHSNERGWSPWMGAQTLVDTCTFKSTGEPCGVRVDP